MTVLYVESYGNAAGGALGDRNVGAARVPDQINRQGRLGALADPCSLVE
jgi:hypothetical protein